MYSSMSVGAVLAFNRLTSVRCKALSGAGYAPKTIDHIHDVLSAVPVENPVLVASVDVQPFHGYASRR